MPAKTTQDIPANPEGARRPSCIHRVSHKLLRSVINLLALVMLFEIVLVVTPATDKLFGWLVITGPPEPADLIVCLGGRYERLVWAAKTFNQGFAPKIVVSNAPGASQEMKRLLTHCGVPAEKIIVDAHSYTTSEHPAGIAAMPGVDPAHSRLLIITDHEHSRRVAACFRRGGFQHFTIYAGPPMSLEPDKSRWRWRILLLPRIAYEYAALLQYWLEGKL